MFSLKSIARCGARLGTLNIPGRKPLQTPGYIAITSRGAVPHLAQDVHESSTALKGIYTALEDYIERSPKETPPVFNQQVDDGQSSLRKFIALDDEAILILGPRRLPPVTCPMSNTSTSIAVYTSVGFSQVSVTTYVDAALKLRPDIVIGLSDIPFGAEKISQKRSEAMTDRTSKWAQTQIKALVSTETDGWRPLYFAPVLPLSTEKQKWYLEELAASSDGIAGLAIHDSSTLSAVTPALQNHPRLGLAELKTPHDLLRQISQGVDIFTVPFVGAATDAGIALDFTFSTSPLQDLIKPLGTDMWSESHATDLSPLSEGCTCYSCSNHHRAYLRHLLSAKEMLGWVLLQIHNHHIMDNFFHDVRQSIGQNTFEQDVEAFSLMYEPELPAKTGQGPRIRGYQFRAEGPGEVKRNPAGRDAKLRTDVVDDATAKVAESAEADPAKGVDVAASGLAERTE